MHDIFLKDDPYVAEVHEIRDRLNKEAGYDPATFAQKAAAFARRLGLQFSSLQPVAPRFSSQSAATA